MKGLSEILTNKKWMMSPEHLQGFRKVIEQNLSSHAPIGNMKKIMARQYAASGEILAELQVDHEGDVIDYRKYDFSTLKNPFVNVLYADGPITRNGGGCSYGSIDHRDMILRAAQNENCMGHVFIIDTPGGSAWAKNDYQQAIEAARAMGQPVIALIDGMCMSAGMYLAALCDERYYFHPENEVGCIGVMAAFYSEKNGDKNAYTNETYHELYDPESRDKNKSYRDIANDENDKLIIDELAVLGMKFRADVKAACPAATDKHLHGRVFAAKDVKGILVDGQADFAQVVQRVFDLHDGKCEPIKRGAAVPLEDETTPKPEDTPEDNPVDAPDGGDDGNQEQSQNNIIMNENYNALAAACGVEELVVTEEGTYLDVSLVDNLANALANRASELASVNAQMETANTEHAQTVADLNAAHEENVNALNATHEEAMNNANAQLEQVRAELATANQSIADLQEQVRALTESAANTPIESPANNGAAPTEPQINTMPAYDTNLSPSENARILAEWKNKHLA